MLPKKYIEYTEFPWEDLNGKTLKINVYKDDLINHILVTGSDGENLYILYSG